MTMQFQSLTDWAARDGAPAPLGATWVEEHRAYNFALYSRHATAVTLLLYGPNDAVKPLRRLTFSPLTNKTGRVWHCRLPEAEVTGVVHYGYKVEGPNEPWNGHRFDGAKLLLDPYAQAVYFPPDYSRIACCGAGPTDGRAPLAVLPEKRTPVYQPAPRPRHTHDAVIYELHVKGFTARANSGVAEARRGTFAGLVEKIPYLKELGVTIVELLPVHQFDPQEGNYWGYMTLSFFSPHGQYAAGEDVAREFREMVQAFHEAGIEVWLDVVFNHTSEGNELGPTYGLKGLDNSTYYLLTPENMSYYVNDSGAGNTTRCAHPAMRELVFASIRHWANSMHIDGFRFDLASVFALADDGRTNLTDPPLVAEIGAIASILDLSLVAEAWDVNTYQLGRSFPGITWGQWNGRFRDDVRSFVKGDPGLVPALMLRLYGSDDLFPDSTQDAYRPYQSINFVTAHDGLCLNDLVSYTRDDHHAWDCGWQGGAGAPPEVVELRKRQVKNFCCLLMLANGVPMFVAGDEFMNTQGGHDNPYNQDNETTWLDWDLLQRNQDVFRFFKTMIAFRRAHPVIGRSHFWRSDVQWFGVDGPPDLGFNSHTLAYRLRGGSHQDDDLYVMINAWWQSLSFRVQVEQPREWLRVVDTALPSPQDVSLPGQEPRLESEHYSVHPRSIVVLRRPHGQA